MSVVGLLLAAGAGRRMGGPKALLRDGAGVPYLDRAVGILLEGGCEAVTVVLGASAADARLLLDEAGWSEDPAVDVVVAHDWDEGMGASLRAGLQALSGSGGEAALVTLVDLPDVDARVLRRVLEHGRGAGAGVGVGVGHATLVRATYDGQPGHPVLIGRDHWAEVRQTSHGDHGARDYLRSHEAVPCECGDLASGRDLDRPEDLPQG